MQLARKALAALLWLYLLGVVVQFLLAGLGLPQLGDQGMGGHEALGYAGLHFTPVLFLVIGVIARLSVITLVALLVFAVLAVLQPFWATEFQGEALASLHVLGALVLLGMAHALARMVTRQAREEGAPARSESA